MSPLRTGALFAGYGGIELALAEVLDVELAWVSEFDAAPSKILAHHWPDVPNLGDVTAIDWTQVEPVDVITGGSPCQDLSHAGRRAGMKPGTRSGLWASMCDAIETIRPRLVIWENVRGALSAAADSAVEPCPFCVGDEPGVCLRALGRVLGDLAELGYDAAWCGLRAADVGAPHGRWRVFVLAWPSDDTAPILTTTGAERVDGGPAAVSLLRTPTAQLAVNGGSQHPEKRKSGGHGPTLADEVEHLLPTPMTTDGGSNSPGDQARRAPGLRTLPSLLPTPTTTNQHGNAENNRGERLLSGVALDLMPTPRATGGTKGGPNQRGSSGDLMLPSAVMLMPTPSVADVTGGRAARSGGRSDELLLNGLAREQAFGQYAAAITRWEQVIGRPAPAPAEPTGKAGAHRLSPRFVEWMMGLPDGWVTDPNIGITRANELKALGNGVCPQQGAAALRHLLAVRASAIAEAVAA